MADESRIVSVVGGCRRTDRWRVSEETNVLTLFGRARIDMRDAETSAKELWISVVSVFASVEIIVPEGTVVEPSGMAFLASASCVVPASDQVSQLPAIEIDSVTVFGRCHIHVGQLPPRRSLWDRLRRRGRQSEPADAPIAAEPPAAVVIGGADLADTDVAVDPLAEPSVEELDDVLAEVLGAEALPEPPPSADEPTADAESAASGDDAPPEEPEEVAEADAAS